MAEIKTFFLCYTIGHLSLIFSWYSTKLEVPLYTVKIYITREIIVNRPLQAAGMSAIYARG